MRQNRFETREGEALSEFFDRYNESLDADSGDCSDTSQLSHDDSSIAPDNLSLDDEPTISTESQTTAEPPLSKREALVSFASKDTSFVAVGMFPFTKLPLSIRNNMYEHVLVVPAIICVKQKHRISRREESLSVRRAPQAASWNSLCSYSEQVDGFKSRFSRFPNTNLNILRFSKEIFSEARAVMYGRNIFDIVKPSNELTPEPDYSVPLFPPGYQRLVTKLSMRIRTFYDLDWLLSGGYNLIKNYYRGLETLTLILEMNSATKGFGRQWAKKSDEEWTAYIKRLRGELAEDLFENAKSKKAANIPTWITLRVLFRGEAYDGGSGALTGVIGIAMTDNMTSERAKREELRSALVETWELFKKGSK